MGTVRIRPKHVQPIWAGHPWVFAQAVEKVCGTPGPGDPVSVVDPQGRFLGQGYWSPDSAIPVRILSRDPGETMDETALLRRIERATAFRRDAVRLPNEHSNAYRLIHAEGDLLPGLIADVFDSVAVVQLLTIGMKRREQAIFEAIAKATGVSTVVERPGGDAQRREGIVAAPRVALGQNVDSLSFLERGFRYEIQLGAAQKTGFFVDQRPNREHVEQVASGRRVLDLFCYAGAFALAAARGGARSVRGIDSSATAVQHAEAHARGNGCGHVSFEQADAKRTLSALADAEERYDLIVLDPPRFAPTARHRDRALRAYRRLNAAALRVAGPDALLVTCSCSAAVTASDWVRMIALAAKDAGREVTIVRLGQAGMDHPTPPAFPEGMYLKSATVRVLR